MRSLKKKSIHFAIVGAGVISSLHAKAIHENKKARLVAICDIDRKKAETLAKKYGADRVYTDYHEMFQRESIDVVSICVQSGLHGEITMAAARTGIHVLCEKPLEITKEKMDQMIRVCKEKNVKLGCVFQRRTYKEAILTRKAIQDGLLGHIVMADAYLKYYRDLDYYQQSDWRGTWALDGGGALMNQGVHGIDLLLWMVGDVESLFTYADHLAYSIEVEDTAVVALTYKNGALGVIQGATTVYPEQETRFEIHGEKGTIIFGDRGFHLWEIKDQPNHKPEHLFFDQDLKGHPMFIEDMIQAIEEDREPLIPGEEARKAVDLILAIYESAKTKKEIHLT